jgi:murein DD-endopeptidase MepM/ murein hydrolase activator NlpD
VRLVLCAALSLAHPPRAAAEPLCDPAVPKVYLPFRSDAPRRLGQGAGGAYSHTGKSRYAWDFEMPEGTAVTAAAPGTVVMVVNDHTQGGPDHKFDNEANFVAVDLGNNRFAVYKHLQFHGARVREGDHVVRGQMIALSGNTGFSSQPHLHFMVVDERNSFGARLLRRRARARTDRRAHLRVAPAPGDGSRRSAAVGASREYLRAERHHD